jgi:hypothetical protein
MVSVIDDRESLLQWESDPGTSNRRSFNAHSVLAVNRQIKLASINIKRYDRPVYL